MKLGKYRYWGDQKPDTSRPLLTISRPAEAVNAKAATTGEGDSPATNGTLRIYGPIDSWGGFWGVSAKEVAQALDLLGDAGRIVVRVNSPGGESSEGRAIVNLLRAHSAEIVTVVDGAAYSAASYIAACGDDTVMSPGSTMMIHDTSTFLYGNAEEFRKAADVLDVLSNSGAELYAEIAGSTVEHWRELQREETWYSAAGAVESGLMKRVAVMPDLGPAETAGDDGPEPAEGADVEERARAAYDLSLFDQGRIPAPLKPPAESSDGSKKNTTQEGSPAVQFSDEQLTKMRQELGLPEDADAATIVAAQSEALAERAEAPAETTNTPKVPEGMVLVEKDVFEGMRTQASEGAAARQQQLDEHRDRVIEQAIRDGKITPARREAWKTKWKSDAEGAEQELGTLEAGLVPFEEVGHGVTSETAAEDDGWFPGYTTPIVKEA